MNKKQRNCKFKVLPCGLDEREYLVFCSILHLKTECLTAWGWFLSFQFSAAALLVFVSSLVFV